MCKWEKVKQIFFNFIKPFLKHLRLRKHFKFMRISWTYPQNRNRPTGAENRLTVAKEEVDGRRMAWEFGFIRCKLVHMEWINNKVLLWSTGNSIQCPVINHNWTEYEKECVYTHTRACVHTQTHTQSIQLHSERESASRLSCLSLCNLMDCSPPGSPVHGILQARILEWITIPFSRVSSWPRNWTQVSCITGRFFTVWATKEALHVCVCVCVCLCVCRTKSLCCTVEINTTL